MFHKEGHKIILFATAIVVAAILLIDTFVSVTWLRMLLQIAFIVFFILILQFFRNPKRRTIHNDKTVVSPVDGKVVVIEEVEETEYFKDKRLQVSVFMSPINVHVTRYPIGGKVLIEEPNSYNTCAIFFG